MQFVDESPSKNAEESVINVAELESAKVKSAALEAQKKVEAEADSATYAKAVLAAAEAKA